MGGGFITHRMAFTGQESARLHVDGKLLSVASRWIDPYFSGGAEWDEEDAASGTGETKTVHTVLETGIKLRSTVMHTPLRVPVGADQLLGRALRREGRWLLRDRPTALRGTRSAPVHGERPRDRTGGPPSEREQDQSHHCQASRNYIASRANEEQRADCKALMSAAREDHRAQAEDVGPSIVGYGSYRYTYDSGRTGEMCLAGFAIRGRELVVYIFARRQAAEGAAVRLGKHRLGVSCLYFKRLGDLDPMYSSR
jgi:hypothetical protein